MLNKMASDGKSMFKSPGIDLQHMNWIEFELDSGGFFLKLYNLNQI